MFLALLSSTQIICVIWKCVSPGRVMALQFGCGCKVKSSTLKMDVLSFLVQPAYRSPPTLCREDLSASDFLFSVLNSQSGAVLETLWQPVQAAARADHHPAVNCCAHVKNKIYVWHLQINRAKAETTLLIGPWKEAHCWPLKSIFLKRCFPGCTSSSID